MYHNFNSPCARDMWGHWVLLGDWEAEDFVNWLTTESNLSSFEIIEELEYQIQQSDAGPQIIKFASEALSKMPVICSQCGRIVPFGSARRINRYKTDHYSEVISRSLVGGSTFRRNTSITYITGYDYYCNMCFTALQIIHKNKCKNKGIKGFLKKLFHRK